ncbi:50S ribosome-binding GTPase [Micromonospora polyrhachis]|uniref:GTPase n=1 Tax=Micromonospora polyrhachis TaxID=1282883 RepID=UPI00161653B2|nr:GTPase [Micromonospora polyrhachis]
MAGIVGRVRDAVRGERRVDAYTLLRRLTALRQFLAAVDGHLPDGRLVAAHTLIERAGDRLALSRDHTVVALAGATGSGKSSLFNALAGFELSSVGVRRPTTAATHACVWGPLAGATKLLDWVGVLPRHRFVRESALDGNDEAALHGLILLDLPDFDSVQRTHRLEVDRLLGLVDQVIWVVDPQKYADRLVHRSYLREFHRHRDVTVVVLNQTDRLPPTEVPTVLADLRRLLDSDQLDGVPLLATSALDPQAVAGLRNALEQTVAERQAALRRLSGDVDQVAEQLTELVGPAEADEVPAAAVRGLTEALAASAGVPAVADAVEAAYRHRAASSTGWPLVRAWRRLRPDPLRRLHLTGGGTSTKGGTSTGGGTSADVEVSGATIRTRTPVGATSLPVPTAAHRAAVGLAVRTVAEQAGGALPAQWPAAVTAAARSRLTDLPDALDQAIATTDLDMERKPVWWRLIGAMQWLVTIIALAGLAWLAVGWVVQALGLPGLDHPKVGVVPVPTLMLLGGLFLGVAVALLVRPIVGWAARRARRRVERRLHAAVAEVGRDHVVLPVQDVLRRYAEARTALADVATR